MKDIATRGVEGICCTMVVSSSKIASLKIANEKYIPQKDVGQVGSTSGREKKSTSNMVFQTNASVAFEQTSVVMSVVRYILL